MATFSAVDMVIKNKNIEISLNAWGQYQPALMFSVREGANFPPSALIPIYYAPALLANISDPTTNSIVQVQNKSGVFVVGRRGNEFVVQINYSSGGSSNGEFSVNLNDGQWTEAYKYIELMYSNNLLIKEINNNIRNVVTGLLRSVGIDFKVNNRFKITPWWDDNVFKNGSTKSIVQEIAEQVVSMMGNSNSTISNNNTPIPTPLPRTGGIPTTPPANIPPMPQSMGSIPPKMPTPPMGMGMPSIPTAPNANTINNNQAVDPNANYNGMLNDAFGSFKG